MKKPKDLTDGELHELPEGHPWDEKQVSWYDDDDLLGWQDKTGQQWQFAQRLNGEWFKYKI